MTAVRRGAALLGRLLLTLLAYSGAGVAAAADGCLPVAGGGELSVAGIGRVVFAALTTDRARDAASLSGGVCLAFEAVDGVLRSERLDLAGLSARVELTASDVTLTLPGWLLTAATLRSDGTYATLDGVVMVGAEAVARAASVRFDLASGSVEAAALRLVTETVWLDAHLATFDGRTLSAEVAWLTTCDCPPESAPLRLEAEDVRFDLDSGRLALTGGVLASAGGRWPLPSPLALDERSLADLTLPFALGADPEGVRGLLLRVHEREVANGVRFAWDVGFGREGRDPDGGFALTAVADGIQVDVVGASQRLRVAWRHAWRVAPGVSVGVEQRLEGGDWREPVRDQAVTLDAETHVAGVGPPLARLEFGARALVALSAQRLAGEEVVGTRWGVEGRGRLVGSDGPAGRLAVDLSVGATTYPAQGAWQTWLAASPSWVVRAGALRLQVDHLSQWVAGASPFGATLDRRSPLHRTDLALRAAAPSGGGWRGVASLTTRFDWRPDPLRTGRPRGVERLQVRVELNGRGLGGALSLFAAGDLAGWVDPRPARPFSASFGATWTRDRWELGTRLDVDLRGGAPAWREAVLFGAWPIRFGDWGWRPYLAFDLAALGRDGAGWWSGHGLEVAWTSCCGIVELGYRHDAGIGTRLHAGITFETHPVDLGRLAAGGAR